MNARPVLPTALLALALTTLLGGLLCLPPAAHAQTMQASTTVNEVFEADGAVQFTSPDGTWRLDYEAGIDANQAAKATLMRLAGTGTSISFSYFTEGSNRILTKASVAKLAWR